MTATIYLQILFWLFKWGYFQLFVSAFLCLSVAFGHCKSNGSLRSTTLSAQLLDHCCSLFYHTGCLEGVVLNSYQSRFFPQSVKSMTITSHLYISDQFVCLEAEACQSSKVVPWFIRPKLLRKLVNFALEAIFFQGAAWTLKLHDIDLYGQKTGKTGRMLSLYFGLLTNLQELSVFFCFIILVNIVVARTDSLFPSR